MATPLILKGNLKIGADHPSAVDMSAEALAFKISATVSTIVIPATLASPTGNRGGSADYSIDIAYLSTDGTDGTLFPALWAAVGTPSKQLYFEGSMRDDVVSAANPLWSGIFIVVGASLGGTAETLSEGSAAFPLIGAPTVALS